MVVIVILKLFAMKKFVVCGTGERTQVNLFSALKVLVFLHCAFNIRNLAGQTSQDYSGFCHGTLPHRLGLVSISQGLFSTVA